MPLDIIPKSEAARAPRRIAVVGSGVAGLSAAWLLAGRHHVTLYEAADRLGGHSNTVAAHTASGEILVDTGFIVFNEPSYPNLTAMLAHLGVATEMSCMSFGVSIGDGRFEYSGRTLSSVFARRSNVASPRFWKMLRDIPRFHRDARAVLRDGFCRHASLGEFVEARGYGNGFREHFLKPMAAAIWSTPQMRVFDYPAFAFLKFFENHGLLQVLNLPEWHTVTGGSVSYVRKLAEAVGDWRLEARVAAATRRDDGVEIRTDDGTAAVYDDVVVATHGDDARRIVGDLDARERAILDAFSYQPNRAVLHVDETQMPKRRRAWSSWNYIGDGRSGAVTYWMNRLQNLKCAENIFVTLNPARSIPEEKIIAAFDYDHPMFNAATARAQEEIWSVQGRGGLWYAGAHLGSGFHEDALQAGLAVAEAIGGVRRPWTVERESDRLSRPALREAAV